MNFIRRIGRDEIYIKYVHQLVNVSVLHPPLFLTLYLNLYRCTCNLKTTLRRP